MAGAVTLQGNHGFCVDGAARDQRHARVLDCNCGAGGIDAFGCDAYYDGDGLSWQVPRELSGHQVTRRMLANGIHDGSFGLAIDNTVLEHVENLESTLTEIPRESKPGGRLIFECEKRANQSQGRLSHHRREKTK